MDVEEFYGDLKDCMSDMSYITTNLRDSLSRMDLAYQEKTGKKLPIQSVTLPISSFNTLSMGDLGMRGGFNFKSMCGHSTYGMSSTAKALVNYQLPKLVRWTQEMKIAVNELRATYVNDTGWPDASSCESHINQLETYLERMNTRYSQFHETNKDAQSEPWVGVQYSIPDY